MISNNVLPSTRRLPFTLTLLAAVALGPSLSARAQQEGPVYNPPPVILITPSTGQNPYLMYVPRPQPVPAPLVPVMPAPPAAPAAPQAEATSPPPAGPTLSDLGKSLRNYFTEDELDLLFEYMKEAVVAAFKGEEVALPPDLAFKLEVLLVRLQKEGGRYLDNLIQQLERDLKRSLKEKLLPPGAAPSPAPPALPQTTPASSPATPSPGPQSGKTRTLSSRTGYLDLSPSPRG
jgi:hypothetical protein